MQSMQVYIEKCPFKDEPFDAQREMSRLKQRYGVSLYGIQSVLSIIEKFERLYYKNVKQPTPHEIKPQEVDNFIYRIWEISTSIRALIDERGTMVGANFFYHMVILHPKLSDWHENFKHPFYASLCEKIHSSSEAAAVILRKTSIAFFGSLPQAQVEQIALSTFRQRLNNNLSHISDSILLKFIYHKARISSTLEALAKVAIQDFRDEFPRAFAVSEAKDKYRLVTNLLQSRFPKSAPSLLERCIVRYAFKQLGLTDKYPTKSNITEMLDKVDQNLNHLVQEVIDAANRALKLRFNNELSILETSILTNELKQLFVNKWLKKEFIPIKQFAADFADLLKSKATQRVKLTKHFAEKDDKSADLQKNSAATAQLEKDKPVLMNIAILNKGEQEKLSIFVDDMDRLAQLAVSKELPASPNSGLRR